MRAPTAVLVLAAGLLAAAGGSWWLRAAPEAQVTADPGAKLVIVEFSDGAVLAYNVTGNKPRFAQLQDMIRHQWPCRAGTAADLAPGLTLAFDPPPAGVRVIRLPRCDSRVRAR